MSNQAVVIKGGRVVDPGCGLDGQLDVYIENGKITAVDKPGSFSGKTDAQQVDAKGQIVAPGLIDIHVHLREPGQEWKETIKTGGEAAVAGGFTAVCCMPNTNPVNDHGQVTEFILEKAAEANLCRVYPIGAISIRLEGESLAPMMELREAGCVAFSDDGQPVWDSALMRKALEYSLMLDTVLTCHEEDKRLSHGFSMNESALSLKLGLQGMPDAAENVMIARDIELARLTGARVHCCHVSTARGALLIQRAKEDGIPITAETAPHYLTLDESAIGEYNAMAKMSMPLRRAEDVEALRAALESGVIDCIGSDHAPHELDSKRVEFEKAAFGIIGFQTTLPLTLELVRAGDLSLRRAIAALTSDAARCLKLTPTTIAAGGAADITLIDLERTMTFNPAMNRSKSSNSPYFGRKLQGLATKTFVGGREVFSIDSFEQEKTE